MRIVQRVGRIPDGDTPLVGQSVAVRKVSDGSTITTLVSDADGFVTLQRDGHLEPFYLHLQGVPGGDKFWHSREAKTAGVICPMELPQALRILGDGVVRGYDSELAVTLSGGGPSFTIKSGAALVAGHPFVQHTAETLFSNTRPASGTRIDRIIIRLYPEGSGTTPGKADLALLQGTIDAGVPALTQTTTVYEVELYRLTVPLAGAITLTDMRLYTGEMPPVADETTSASLSTTDGSGVSLLILTLTLPRTGTYDVDAWASCIHQGSALQATYGSTGSGTAPNFDTPAQVAADSSGNIYVADTANNRLVKLNSSGAYVTSITSLSSICGVCLDSSNNVYVVYVTAINPMTGVSNWELKKYNSSLALQWTGTGSSTNIEHIATDGTNIYICADTILVYLCSTGASSTSWGSTGSGNGQFTSPYGVVYDSSEVYVVDAGNSRVQVFDTSGAYQRQWTIPAGCRGIAVDGEGNILVACFSGDTVYRYSTTGTALGSFAQTDPDGVVVTTGDVAWVSNATDDTIAKWALGYGGIALDIDGNLGDYLTLTDMTATLQNAHAQSVTGPASITISLYGKATSGTAALRSVVLAAVARPRS